MIVSPVLLCQGFQRAFVEPNGAMFSVSASVRRATCEINLRHARQSGWAVVHTFLDHGMMRGADEAAIPGFSPLPSERYFWQGGLSAFGYSPVTNFEKALFPYHLSPVFLMSFAGLGAISATLLSALDKRFVMNVVIDAVADTASQGVGERERIDAIETLARSYECAVTSGELTTLSVAPPPAISEPVAPARHLLSQSGR